MNRKLFILGGLLCLIGIGTYAQAPVANFTANVTSGCAPLTVTFKDQSSNNPTSWAWDLGGGTTSAAQNPVISYGAGTYTVTLIVKNASGADAIRKTGYIVVYPAPNIQFTANLNLACAPANIQFTDNSTPGQGTITSWNWKFGDGSTSTQQNPLHVYTQTGYYDVTLVATNSGGCTATGGHPRFIRVVQGIQPNFAWDQVSTTCTAPYLLNFDNQTAAPGTVTYNWTFNGATPGSSSDPNPAGISYPSAGSYSVTLNAQSSLGCSGSITQTVPLSPGSPLINGPATGCINTPIAFSDGSTPKPISSSWTFGDGGTSTSQTPTHSYTAAGTYTVTLVTTSATCSNTVTKTVTIGTSFTPTFSATPTTGCQAPLTVTFTDQTTPPLSSQSWTFGDGSTGTGSPVSHTYNAAGNYNVKLVGTNADGCQGTDSLPNVVQITAPTINMPPLSGCVGSPIPLSATVTAIDGIKSYSWSASGGTLSSTTAANPTLTVPTQGYYSLTLTVTTNGGCSVTQTFNNIVTAGNPVMPTFTATPNPQCGNDPVNFSAPYPPGQYQLLWNFGDMTTDTGSTVSHIYKNFGNFNATLTLVNFGCPQNAPASIVIKPPIPNFGYTTVCPTPLQTTNFTVNFIDSSKVDAGPLTYVWDFNDGSPVQTITAPPYAPAHTYATAGTYNVTLTITDGTGPTACTNSVTKPVVVDYILPSFTVAPNPVCVFANDNFNSTSQSFPFGAHVVASYTWIMDGTPHGGGHAFPFGFASVGSHTAQLEMQDFNGCNYFSPTSTIQVTGPIAKFSGPASGGGCINSPVTFTDNSVPYPGPPALVPIVKWNLNFGDGTNQTFTAAPLTHEYTDTGTYTVTLEAIDNAGCATASAPMNIQITKPQSMFAGPDSFYCPGAPLTFVDSSKGYGPFTENWNFGDGSGWNQPNPHSFPPPDSTYNVSLIISDKNGCADTSTNPVRIQAPIAAFDISDTTAICAPLETMFTAHPQYDDSLYWNFGDGSSSTLPITSHFYNTIDTFYASLIVQGPGGCLDSTTRRVLISNPNASTFHFDPTLGCDSVIAQFNIVPPDYTRFTLAFGDNSPLDSSQSQNLIHPYRSPGTYTPSISLTDSTGCIVGLAGNNPSDSNSILVLGATPFFTASQQAFCDSGTVVFTDYTITNDGIISKVLSFGDGTSGSQAPPLTNPYDTTHYYNRPGEMLATLTATTGHNCVASYTDTIEVYQTPHPQIATTGNLCTGLIQLVGSLTTPDIDTVHWHWNLGDGQTDTIQSPQVNYKPGTYQLSLRAYLSFGCNDTATGAVTVNPLPVIKGPAMITTPVGVPITIPFTYSSNITTYVWTPATNLDCPTCANPAATLTFAQQYTVQVTDSNNCVDTASILIKTVCNDENYFLPNTFSPNHDGVNDYFYPRGTSIYNIQSMRVFNRWGQLVFQRQDFPANSETMGWDGNFNGHPAPADAYVYIVEVICNNAQVIGLHGTVTLVR